MTTLVFPSGEEMNLDMAPNQPRDRYGKWTNNPGTAVSGAFSLSARPKGFQRLPESRAHQQLTRMEKAGVVVVNREDTQMALVRMEKFTGVPMDKMMDSLTEFPPELLKGSQLKVEATPDGFTAIHLTDPNASKYSLNAFKMVRKLDPRDGVVEHELMGLPPSYQGKGIGKRVLAKQVEAYQAPGSKITQVGITAGASVGGYAWGKFGFAPNATDAVVNRIRQKTSDPLTHKLLDTVKDKKSWYRFVDSSVGKSSLLGEWWFGGLDLKDPLAMSRFRKYVKK